MEADLVGSFVRGFLSMFVWPTLGYLLLGVAIGYVVGIVPGLGGVTGLAIILPFTFDMRAVDAFALLLAVATVCSSTGDFTSILFGTPGEATAAALIPDGYAMTKQGEAERALSGNLLANLIGSAVGAFALVAAIPIVRPLVLSFSSPELFMLCVLGITFVGSLSTGAVAKGLLAGLLGLFLSLVGMDPQSGIQRYTFGQIHLWEGIGLVPVALGLFAIPELYDLSVRRTSIARLATKVADGGVWRGLADARRHLWLIIRCSIIGTVVSILPGLGASVSQWLAYSHAVQSSPDRSRFGNGAPEGALGPGAANNSGLGGSLITMLAFGVPSGLTSAILMGAFLIQGLQPGPTMLTTELDLVMSFVWAIVVSNLVVVIITFPILRQLTQLTFVRATLMVPIVILLVFLGAFASNNALLDIFIMLAAGVLGIVMVALGWPRPPLILGLVLGGLAENYVFLAHARYGFSFLTRPIVLVLIAISVLVVIYPIIARALRSRARLPLPTGDMPMQDPTAPSPQASAPTSGRSRLSPNALFTLLLFALAAFGVVGAKDWALSTRLMPWVVGIPMLGLAGAYAALQIGGFARESRAQMELGGLGIDVPLALLKRRSVEFAAWLLTFSFAVIALGFVYGGPLITLAYFKSTGRERWPISLALSAAMLVAFLLMRDLLRLPMNEGWIFEQIRT